MIGKRSLHDNAEVAQSLAPAAHTANGNGASIALEGSQAWVFEIGVGVWTDGTHTLHFEDSDDGTTWAAIDADDLDGYSIDGTQQLATGGQTLVIGDATKDGEIFLVAYVGAKSHVRVRRAIAGATTGATYYANVWKLGLRYSGRNPMRTNWDLPNVV